FCNGRSFAPELQRGFVEAYAAGLTSVFRFAVPVVIVGLVAALLLKDLPLQKRGPWGGGGAGGPGAGGPGAGGPGSGGPGAGGPGSGGPGAGGSGSGGAGPTGDRAAEPAPTGLS